MAFRVFNVTLEKTNYQSENNFSFVTFFNHSSLVKILFDKCVVVYDLVNEISATEDCEGETEITKETNEYSNVVQHFNIHLPELNINNFFNYSHVYISQYVNEISHPPPEA